MKILLCTMFGLFLFAYLNSNSGYARLGFHLVFQFPDCMRGA